MTFGGWFIACELFTYLERSFKNIFLNPRHNWGGESVQSNIYNDTKQLMNNTYPAHEHRDLYMENPNKEKPWWESTHKIIHYIWNDYKDRDNYSRIVHQG